MELIAHGTLSSLLGDLFGNPGLGASNSSNRKWILINQIIPQSYIEYQFYMGCRLVAHHSLMDFLVTFHDPKENLRSIRSDTAGQVVSGCDVAA